MKTTHPGSIVSIKILLLVSFLSPQASHAGDFTEAIVSAAIDRTKQVVRYDGSYISIAYPNGDVPANVGVCTDLVIRSYRAIGADLQQLVHEDMRQNFDQYPSKRIWGLDSTDRNIDHRRVPNLQVFFSRHGKTLAITDDKENYRPGDVVTWMLAGNLPHIGIVTNRKSSASGNPLISHNIGAGPNLDDMLFSHKITGHYRYVPSGFNE